MAKIMTQNELDLHIAEASDMLTSFMTSLALAEHKENKKKATLLGYWIKKYVSLIKREPQFTPKSLPRYKRGQILNIDFGFRIGNELGGLHYAVVLDVRNAQTSPIITVVPLMSYKPQKFKQNNFTVLLPDGIYSALEHKFSATIKEASELMSSNSQEYINELETIKLKLFYAENILEELKHLRGYTVANTCQITTISKLRITQPLNTKDVLYNVRLSQEDMNCIYEQLRSLYLVK